MALNSQNKSFLGILSRLGMDVKQFPDKTFDGLFENVPEDINYFFNWFIDNLSSDNALTPSEQATYFQLQSTHSLPSEEEMNYVLSSCSPAYEELMSLDISYVNNHLSLDSDDLKKNFEELSNILADTEANFHDVKRKQNCMKEEMNIKKKMLSTTITECHTINLSFGHKLDEVKMFLFEEPCFRLNLDLFNDFLKEERNIFYYFTKNKLLENGNFLQNGNFNNAKQDLLPKLKEDLTCVQMSMILSEGFCQEKKARIDFLLELFQNKASKKSFNFNFNFIQSYLENDPKSHIKIEEEIKSLETELFEKIKLISDSKVQEIADHYLLNKIDLNKSLIGKISNCKKDLEFNWKMSSYLLHILIRCNFALESILDLRKQLYCKLNEYETNFSNDLTMLELRRQRFREMSTQKNQHPFLLELKNIMNLEESFENNEVTLKKIIEMMLYANDDSNFFPHKCRNLLQSSVKIFFDNSLCGPTNQILFAPIELLIKFQECDERESSLSQVVKRLASKYVGAKETISKSDRKKLLLWIDSLTNPQALFVKANSSPLF